MTETSVVGRKNQIGLGSVESYEGGRGGEGTSDGTDKVSCLFIREVENLVL